MAERRNAKSPQQSGKSDCHARRVLLYHPIHQRIYSSTSCDHVPATDFHFGRTVGPLSGVRIAESPEDSRLADRICAKRECTPDGGTAPHFSRKTIERKRGRGGGGDA